jgi:hypothetical protein
MPNNKDTECDFMEKDLRETGEEVADFSRGLV